MLSEVSWTTTWAHPSLRAIANTAFSLDHIVSEGLVELVTAVPAYFLGKRAVRRHDALHHTQPTDRSH